ncbi:hypothetical protein EG329_006482 [Mollisiaceae sp. DMI_Dod_QoI]|nr:hypothetical protein EG329_006482 [Helotiales sp. DMI_Dod_QoI]
MVTRNPTAITAPAEKALHLYRRLLRAVTYVPDSFARTYAHDFIVSRFKANCTPASLAKPNAKVSTANRLKKARHWTRILESSAQGSVEDLHKVLIQVHGRQGARKRVLLQRFLQPEESELPKDNLALEEFLKKPIRDSTMKLERGTKLYVLSRSQQEHHPKEHIKTKLRHLEPKIPKENIWGRPTPRKLAESMRRRWWADTIDKLLPPVPHSEWERLRDFASGVLPLEQAPPPRAKGTFTALHKAEDTPEQLLNALRSPARLSRFGIKKLEFDTSHGLVISNTEESVRTSSSHSHARSRRRMYASIWTLTPTMTHDELTNQWVVRWGGQKSRALDGAVSQPTTSQIELFEGVDSLCDKPLLSKWQIKKSRRKAILEEE